MSQTGVPTAETRPVHPVRPGHIRADVARLAADLDARPDLARGGLLLDFRQVEYVGSEDLSSLVVLHKRARAVGAKLTLVNVGPAVSDLLNLTRLDTLFAVRRAGERTNPPVASTPRTESTRR